MAPPGISPTHGIPANANISILARVHLVLVCDKLLSRRLWLKMLHLRIDVL